MFQKRYMILLLLAGLVVCFIYGVFSARDRALVFESPQTLHVGDREREYRVYAPSSEEPQPLVIALHGYRSDRSKSIEFYSGLSNLATEKHFVAVYPYGIENSWNGGFCCGTAFETNIDDVAFMRALVTELSQTYQIDQRKIYVVGMSNGGVMAQRLLAEMPDVFAAGVAVMSGVGDKDAVLDISGARAPLMLVNGTRDQYVPLARGTVSTSDGYMFLSVSETKEMWAKQYGVEQVLYEYYGGFETYWYGDAEFPQLVSRIYPTSHRWPKWRFTHPFTRVPEVTRDIWDFLNSRSLEKQISTKKLL
jgi:polyhydroxybutyrate depolymerase